MANTIETADPDEVQDWIEERGGEPAVAKEGSGELRVNFGGSEEVEAISWKEFREILDEEELMMVYEQDSLTGSDETSPSEEYEFVRETRTTPEDTQDTEMDNEQVQDNIEETST